MCGLIRIGGEQPPSVRAPLEGDIHRRSCGLEAARGGWLAELAQQVAARVEDQYVGCERIVRSKIAADARVRLFIATAWESMSRFQHIHFEILLAAAKREAGRKVKPGLEHGHGVARRNVDVLAAVGTE